MSTISNYGEIEAVISFDATETDIKNTMREINWENFHQVVLEKQNGDWLEVGGNLKDDGLSAMLQKNGKQKVIETPPTSVEHMTEILLSYFRQDNEYQRNNKFK